MSLESWGWLLVAFGLVVFVYGYHLEKERIQEIDSWIELRREIDRAVPVWSRPHLYDWSASGDFE